MIIRLLCVSTGAIPEKLALREFIDWLQTKGCLYSRQDIIRLNRFFFFPVETRPLSPISRYPRKILKSKILAYSDLGLASSAQ